ncbi:MAG: O-antigen ligase family protein [Bacteroidia bacterium]
MGLPLGEFFMSVGTIALFVNWLIEGNFRAKFLALKNNRIALAIISIFLMHVVGLLWTSDFEYGLHDLKIKLPLLIIPLVLGSINYLEKNSFLTIFLVFVAAIFLSALISVGVYINLKWIEKNLQNHRDISIFISHIRLSLMVVFSMVGLFYFLKKQEVKKGYVFALCVFFVLFLILLQSLTGIGLLIIFIILFLLFWNGFKLKQGLFSFGLFLSFSMALFFACLPFYKWYFVAKENIALEKTMLGNFYRHDLDNHQLENGFYVWRNISDSELKSEWEKRSPIIIDSIGKTKQPIKATLIRYLTSKHLTKDAQGVKQLSNEDVLNIENGITHFKNHSSIFNRVDEFFFELSVLKNNQNPSNNSFGQRVFVWKLSFEIIKENVFYGVGTGDVLNTFNQKYKEQEMVISKQIRAHNQVLTFFIAFGIFGLIPLIAIFYFAFKKSAFFNELKLLFVGIILFSFLFEDTLETQAGVTFFAFFSGLFSSKHP